MRPLKSPVNHYAWNKSFLENIRMYFGDLGLYEFITKGKWLDEMNLPTSMFKPPEGTEQITKNELSYLESRVYHFIIGYMKKTVLDPNIKNHFDRVTEFNTIEELESNPRKLLKDLEKLCSKIPMRTLYAGFNFSLPLRRMSPDHPFTNELLIKLQRNINLMQTAVNNKYPTDKIRTITDVKEIINKRENLIFKSLACFIMNSPSTFDIFDDNNEKLEKPIMDMLSNFKEYNTAIQTDRINKIYGTIGTISYQLDPSQEKEGIRRSSQRRTPNNTNSEQSFNSNNKTTYNSYKTGSAEGKVSANGIMIQCKRCFQNYIGNSEKDTHRCKIPNNKNVNFINKPAVL